MSVPMIETRQADASRPPARDKERWQAVKRRDAAFDGKFLFAVRTTGIYCRPSCASRPAKRENVSFFPTAAEAEKAGFRACKRCRPDKLGAPDPQVEAVRQAARGSSRRRKRRARRARREAGLSPYHFHRVFKAITGVTPKAYAAATRARRAADKLRTAGTVTEAIYDAASLFEPLLREHDARLGMTPARSGAAGRDRRFASRSGRRRSARCWSPPRQGRVRDPVRRRSGSAGARPSGSLSARGASRRRPRIRAQVAQVVGLVEAPGQRLDCRSISAAPRSSSGCGRRSAPYLQARQRRTPTSLARSVSPTRCAPSPRPAAPIRSRSRSRAIGWCGGRRHLRLSVGRRAQAQADRSGSGVMKARNPAPSQFVPNRGLRLMAVPPRDVRRTRGVDPSRRTRISCSRLRRYGGCCLAAYPGRIWPYS